jgi:hypothetical protein
MWDRHPACLGGRGKWWGERPREPDSKFISAAKRRKKTQKDARRRKEFSREDAKIDAGKFPAQTHWQSNQPVENNPGRAPN